MYHFSRWTYWLEYDCYAAGIAVGDIDDDGTDEIVIGTQCSIGDGIPYFDYDQGTGRFTLKHLPKHHSHFGAVTKLMIFDFDKDGKKELVGTGNGFYVIKSIGTNQFQTVFFDSVDTYFDGNNGITTIQISINYGLINGSVVTALGSVYAVIENNTIVQEYGRVYSFKNYGINNYQRYWTSELIDTGRIFSISIADMDKDGKESFIFPLQLSRGKLLDYEKTTVSNIENHKTENEIQNFELSQNYPNPFNPITKIKYSIPSEAKSDASKNSEFKMFEVKLVVYDLLGREVAVLVNEPKQPGEYEIEFDASKYGLSSGVYLYQLTAGSFISTKKFVYLR
jgi:hypothetical protein